MDDNQEDRATHHKPIKQKSIRSLNRSIQKRIKLSDQQREDIVYGNGIPNFSRYVDISYTLT